MIASKDRSDGAWMNLLSGAKAHTDRVGHTHCGIPVSQGRIDAVFEPLPRQQQMKSVIVTKS